MKRILSTLAIALSLALLWQSIPVYAIADTLNSEESPALQESEKVENDISAEDSQEHAPYILGEMTDERTLDTKVFRMSDGSYTAAVYPTQVHYEEDGEMKEIDYRFEEITINGESFFETKAGPVSLRAPETIGENSEVVFSSGDHSISFSLSAIDEIEAETLEASTNTSRLEALSETVFSELLTDAEFEELYSKAKSDAQILNVELADAISEMSDIMMSAPGAASAVKYESVMNGIDLNYSLSGTMLKEEIVLNRQASALKTFSFTLCTGDLVPVLNTDKSVSLNNSEGEEKFKITAPFMFDKVGSESTNIDVSLIDNGNGTYTYKLVPDKKWLGSAARIYPVTIDPPVTDSNFYTVKDTTGVFSSNVGSLNNVGELNYLKVGKRYDSNTGTTPEVQAMLYSQLPAVINSTTNIVHAYLYLYGFAGGFSSCPNDMRINAYMITEDWNTTNVMENTPLALGSNGKANYSNVLDYVYYNDSARKNKIYRLEITEAAQKWLDKTNPNYGIAVRASNLGSAESYARFYDSTNRGETDTEGNPLCPRFVYVYRDSKGIEDYWTFTSMEAGRIGTAGVNNYNGNFVTVHEIVSSTGSNMPVSVSINYSANSKDNGTAGMGVWRTNYHMKIETCNLKFKIPGLTNEIIYKYCYRDSDGTKHYLKEEGTEHKDEDGLGLTLTTSDGNVTGYYYKIEDKNHTEYQFDFYGRLTKIVDPNGNYNKVVYEAGSGSDSSKNRILYIEEGSDMSTSVRRTTLELNSNSGDITVTTPEGNYATLDFISSTNRMLNGIIYEDNVSTAFEYVKIGEAYLPTKITDGKGHQTTITYKTDAPNKVSSIKWGTATEALSQYQFSYDHNTTAITDIEGRKTTLQFNGSGHTVSVVDHTSSVGQAYKLGDPGVFGDGSENKLLLVSKAIYASENRINGAGFNSAPDINKFLYSSNLTKTYSSDEGNSAKGSLKITKSYTTSTALVYQNVSGLATGKYTVSLYVRTKDDAPLSGSGVQVFADVYSGIDYATGTSTGRVIPAESDGWVRIQTTVTVPSGASHILVGLRMTESTTGTIYIDDIQLEHNISGGAGSFNQLTNASLLNSLSGWTNSSGFSTSYKDASAPTGLKYVATVNGSPDGSKNLTQTVNISGKKNDVFIAGAWAKANSVPVYDKSKIGTCEDNSENKKDRPEFGIHVTFYNGNAKAGETFEAQFNSISEDWQFLTDKVIAPGDYTKVEFSFVYAYNTGSATVATPFLYKESYGQSYVYDKDGNVISATDAAETEADFAYQNDALVYSLSPTGSRYMYANDDTTDNTIYSVSNSGQKIGFRYNDSGDATNMEIKDLDFIGSLFNSNNTRISTIDCYLVNAKNGRVLEPHAMSANNVTYAKIFDGNSTERWQLQYLSGHVYSVRCLSNTGLSLSTDDSGLFRINTVTVNSAYVPDVPFKFTFVSNGDGTFKIATAKSNYTEYLYQTDSLHYPQSNSYALASAEYDENDPAFKWYLVATTDSTLKMKTSATYTDDGLYLEKSVDAVGNETIFEYKTTANGTSTGLIDTATDPRGNKTKYTYDNMDRTTKVEGVQVDANDNETVVAQVEYAYEKDLLKNISVDGGEIEYEFVYDDFGRKTSVSVGNGTDSRTLASYLYVRNLVSRQSYGNGAFVDLTYDSLDRLIRKTYNENSSKYVEYLYDPNGNQYGIIDSIGESKTFFEFDLAGRVNGVGVYGLDNIMRAYQSVRYNDGKGTVESMTQSMFDATGTRLNTLAYEYTYGDPTKGEMPDTLYNYKIIRTADETVDTANFAFTYDALARLQNRTLTFGDISKSESYTYKASNTAGYTTTLVESMTDFSGKTHTYTYDANGNILTDTYDGNTVSYEYDSLNRMVRYNDPVYGWTYVYVYDDRGNITEMQEHYYTTGTLGAPKSVIEYEYSNLVWADLLTSYWGEEIVYDEIGNPLNWIWGETLTWQNGRQLASYDGTVNYTYTADGLRTGKSGARNTDYYVLNGTYLGEVTTIGGIQYLIAYIYGNDGSVCGIEVSSSASTDVRTYYFVKNLQGDVLSIIDTTGAVVANYRYDAYGYIISVTDANGSDITSETHIANLNPFRYRGYMYDEETGFYYLRSRYYDPYIGRFINADNIIITNTGFFGYNMFAYCVCNPVNAIDTCGMATDALEWWVSTMWWLCGVDTAAPIGDIVYVGGIIITGIIVGFTSVAIIEEVQDVAIDTDTDITDAKTDVIPDQPKDNHPVFYGAAYIGRGGKGKTWGYCTGPMTFEQALQWSYSTASYNYYGKSAAWGIYTPNQEDAYDFAYILFWGRVSIPDYVSGNYPHYHSSDHMFLDKYSHFHVWYGTKIP